MAAKSITGIGNAIVDILLEVADEQFNTLDLEKGSMCLVDAARQKELLQVFSDSNPVLVSGGSVANSLIAFAQLGGEASFTSCIGDDRYGLHYESEFEQLGIKLAYPALVGETTGTCVVMITPDAERTMQTSLGVSANLGPAHVQTSVIEEADWVLIEGYVLSSESGQAAVQAVIDAAKESGKKVAVTFSAEFIVEHFGEALRRIVPHADLLVANHSEALAYTGEASLEASIASLSSHCSHVVVTDGSNGAHLFVDGQQHLVPAVATTPKDVTGAGDMFLGAYLYGICHGYEPQDAARGACFLSHKIIQTVGARLPGDIKKYWKEAL